MHRRAVRTDNARSLFDGALYPPRRQHQHLVRQGGRKPSGVAFGNQAQALTTMFTSLSGTVITFTTRFPRSSSAILSWPSAR